MNTIESYRTGNKYLENASTKVAKQPEILKHSMITTGRDWKKVHYRK